MGNRAGTACTAPDGTSFISYSAAARALGVDVSTVCYHMRKHGHLEYIGSSKCPVSDGRRNWDSMKCAGEALRRARNTIGYHLSRHGHLRNVGAHGGRRHSKPLRIGPIEWDAKCDAQRELGVSKPTLRLWMSKDATPEQKEKLMARVMAVQAKRLAAARRAAERDGA